MIAQRATPYDSLYYLNTKIQLKIKKPNEIKTLIDNFENEEAGMRKNKFLLKRLFKKVAMYTLTTYLFLLICFQPAFPKHNLRYYLEVDELTWDTFYVNITIKNDQFEKLLCGIPEIYPWLSLDYHTENNISEFKVSDRYGEKLLFNQINSNNWLIEAKDKDIVNISYKISNRKDQILGERLSRNFARVDCGCVFVYIREFKKSPIYLTVRVPDGWKLATALQSTSQFFEYNVDNYEQLIKHTLYMAPFDEIYFRIKDHDCFIIVDGRQTADVRKLSAIPAKVAFYQTKLFNEVPFDQYLFIFKIFSGQRQVVSKAYENTSIMYLTYDAIKENLFDIAKEISSNFFQVWNGNRFYPQSMKWDELKQHPCTSNLWFCYGLSDYYGGLTLVRAGYWSEQDFINYNIKLINRFLHYSEKNMPSVATLSSHIMKYDYKKSMAFIRLKGQLIGLLLDLRIRQLTDARRSLDDVMLFMNKWFGNEGVGYHDGDILRAIDAVTGVDLTSFFDLYIYGTADLPFIESWRQAGIFLESKLDTVPDLGELNISTDTNIVTHISKTGPLENSGLKIGDKLISLNDQKIFYPQQIEETVDTLTVGQEVFISVQREGHPLMLIVKVAGRPCNTVSLVSAEPQTEQQQMIRKAWLAKQLP